MSSVAYRLFLAAFAASFLSVFPSIARAQAPAAIYACVHKSSEQVRIVPPNEECKSTETRMTWSVQGPKGDRGVGLDTGAITGQALSCSGGLAGAMAYLSGESFVAVTGSDGAFRLSYVPPGTYDLVIESPSGVSAVRPGIAVATATTTPVGAITVGNFMTDPANCGSCGHACTTGQVCSNGQCTVVCTGGTTRCGNVCVNTSSDNANCGACGVTCASGQACQSGQCVLSCPAGQTRCGNTCVNTATDAFNCGMCGRWCTSGQTCVDSQCTLVCPLGTVNCDGVCRDLRSDPSACGMCGSVCAPGQACANATCTCSSASCAAGCCSGSACNSGLSPVACGSGGNACASCVNNTSGTACVPTVGGGRCGCNTAADCPGAFRSCVNNACLP